MNERENIHSTKEEDAATESAVLQLVLALHPASLTVEELARELDGSRSAERHDDLDRALRDLAGAGLINRSGALVLPTRAALRFDELMER